MCFALLNSGSAVTSSPSIKILPEVTGNVPATEFKSVDLPAPLPPIIVIKSPSFTSRFTPFKMCFSFTVPISKNLCIFSSLSIFAASLFNRIFKVLCKDISDCRET